MDPVTALSVTCNVLQLVEAGYSGAQLCWEIYQTGSDARHARLHETAQRLESACVALSTELAASGSLTTGPGNDPLVDLSNRCQNTAQQLIEELQNLTIPAKSNPLVVIGKSFKSITKARKIQALKEQLDSYQTVLDTQILVKLSQQSSRLSASQIEARANLDVQTKITAARIEAGETKVTKLITTQNLQTRNEIEHLQTVVAQGNRDTQNEVDKLASSFQNTTLKSETQAKYDKVLESLHFPEINLRQSSIEDAHKRTCRWILEGVTDQQPAWNSFVDWLSNGSSTTYWVQGKAGCGKSTLMSYLLEEAAEPQGPFRARLPDDTIVLSVFLWEGGTDLQRTVCGLLRSLLWQILEKCALEHYRMPLDSVLSISAVGNNVWSQRLLLKTISSVLGCLKSAIFVFIDGLDEVRDDEAVIDVLGSLTSFSRIKMCVSSRWSAVLNDYLGNCPMLRMQDLTRSDINLYIGDKLLRHPKVQKLAQRDSRQASRIVDVIQEGAQGVFLWVKLVIKDVLRGMQNADDLQTIHRRIERMPKDVYELYNQMWQRIRDDHDLYRHQAAFFFRLILLGEMSLIAFALAIDEATSVRILTATTIEDIMASANLIEFENVVSWIRTRCAGLIEIDYKEPIWLTKEYTLNFPPEHLLTQVFQEFDGYNVHFAHRTVVEYLTSTEVGRSIVDQSEMTMAQTVMSTFQSGWCYYMLMIILGSTIHLPACKVSIDQSHAKNEVFAKVEKLMQLLAKEGFLHLTRDWGDQCAKRSWSPRTNIFPADESGDFVFPIWLMMLGNGDYLRWKHERGLLRWSQDQYSQALWAWAVTTGHSYSEEKKVQKAHSGENLEVVSWLLAQGADPSYQFYNPCGATHFSTTYQFCLLFHEVIRRCTSEKHVDLAIDQIARLLDILLAAGADLDFPEIKPACRDFFSSLYPSAQPMLIWGSTLLGLMELYPNHKHYRFLKLQTLLQQRNAKARLRLLCLSHNGMLYPLSDRDSNYLKHLWGLPGLFWSHNLKIRSWLRGFLDLKWDEYMSKVEAIMAQNKPFASPRDAMKFCGWSEVEIEHAYTHRQIMCTEVRRYKQRKAHKNKLERAEREGLRPAVAYPPYMDPSLKLWEDCPPPDDNSEPGSLTDDIEEVLHDDV